MNPRLTIVYPAHVSSASLTLRSVLALRGQTADPASFEVVIGADGGDPKGTFAAIATSAGREDRPGQPVSCRVVSSPRPRGNVGHRNHARNAGWREARGVLCWMLDNDFIVLPHGVEHVLAEHDRLLSSGHPSVLTTCLAGIGDVGPADWLSRSEPWVASGEPGDLATLLGQHSVDWGIYSGFPERYSGGAEPASEVLAPERLPEGMPILWRGLLEAMDGFDQETFGEWGADKEEFMERLKGGAKAGLYELRLLRSVMPLHQPHERDPGHRGGAARRRQQENGRRKGLIARMQPWWRGRLKRMQDAMPSVIESARS